MDIKTGVIIIRRLSIRDGFCKNPMDYGRFFIHQNIETVSVLGGFGRAISGSVISAIFFLSFRP